MLGHPREPRFRARLLEVLHRRGLPRDLLVDLLDLPRESLLAMAELRELAPLRGDRLSDISRVRTKEREREYMYAEFTACVRIYA